MHSFISLWLVLIRLLDKFLVATWDHLSHNCAFFWQHALFTIELITSTFLLRITENNFLILVKNSWTIQNHYKLNWRWLELYCLIDIYFRKMVSFLARCCLRSFLKVEKCFSFRHNLSLYLDIDYYVLLNNFQLEYHGYAWRI